MSGGRDFIASRARASAAPTGETGDAVIAVLAGGTSAEREVSLRSGEACAAALSRSFPTRLFVVDEDKLPTELDAGRHVVFSTLHGGFGEDGGMQRLLEAAGFAYAGCDAASSAFTMDKSATKAAFAERGGRVARGISFSRDKVPPAEAVIAELGEDLVVKPNAEGSSVGLAIVRGVVELREVLGRIADDPALAVTTEWLVEERIFGAELSAGVLNGRAQGVVEICPRAGVYDYANKYTAGATEYFAPARIGEAETAAVRQAAEQAFECCACRDFARVDFILREGDKLPFLLEVNTLPGMTATSLLPKSAGCCGLDFEGLVREMVLPALGRFGELRRGGR